LKDDESIEEMLCLIRCMEVLCLWPRAGKQRGRHSPRISTLMKHLNNLQRKPRRPRKKKYLKQLVLVCQLFKRKFRIWNLSRF